MNEFCLQLISLIHILYILFIVITPFTNYNYMLLLHCIVVPFMMLHWVVNDNTCVLTMIEKKMRFHVYGTVPLNNECYMSRLIEPVYDFKKNYQTFSVSIYAIVIMLWLISVYRLYSKYKSGEIRRLSDLFCLQ